MSDEFTSPTNRVTLADLWPTPEAVARCADSDAGFLAVHQPARLLRLTPADSTGTPADEQAVLAALLKPDLPAGFVVVSIVGLHGAGKSHLLRWLRLHVGEGHRVISIPRSTDAAQLQERLRAELKSTEEPPEAPSEEVLLTRLREALKQRTADARAECDASMKRDGKVDPALRAIAETHGPGLVALLEGPTKDVLPRDTLEFKAADFEFHTVQTQKLTDPKLQRYVQKLKTNMQNERATAAALLNEIRAGVMARAVAESEKPLTKLVRRVREELHAEGKEFVLLLDGFDALEESESELREILTMENVREGKAALCPLRTALTATTPGELLGEGFAFAEQFAEEELLASITDMIGAYLNAARSHALGELSEADRERVAAFGTSRQGHLLFPFTQDAIRELARLHLMVEGQLRFNPGNVIERVLLRPLQQPEILEAFTPRPTEAVAEPVPEPVAEPQPVPAVEERDPLAEIIEKRRAAASPELLAQPDVPALWNDLLAMIDAAVSYRREPVIADTLKAAMRSTLEEYRDAISLSWIGWIHANMPRNDTDLAPPEPTPDDH